MEVEGDGARHMERDMNSRSDNSIRLLLMLLFRIKMCRVVVVVFQHSFAFHSHSFAYLRFFSSHLLHSMSITCMIFDFKLLNCIVIVLYAVVGSQMNSEKSKLRNEVWSAGDRELNIDQRKTAEQQVDKIDLNLCNSNRFFSFHIMRLLVLICTTGLL